MLTILGRSNAINVMKVLWACEEMSLAFERKDVGGKFGGRDTPEYLALNPAGRIPTVIDGDTVLWESNSIIRYLAAKYSYGKLYPADLAHRARAERWMDWYTGTAAPALLPVYWQLVRLRPENRYDALPQGVDVLAPVPVALRRLAGEMAVLDAGLQDSRFLAGDDFTIAEFGVGIVTYRWFNMPIERPELPRLAEWYARLTERPGFRKHIMVGVS